ncbi:retrotransposon protein, putative, ty1-copia subclass [Tanacetum coccineum]
MHNMGKTVGELHDLLIEYEKGKGKRKGKVKDKSYIPKIKNLKHYAKEHSIKDDACHHCKEVGHYERNCPAYLAELIKKKQVGTASSSGYPKETMGYYFYFPPENKTVVASKIPMDVEAIEPPQEEVVPVHRSARTHLAPDCLCLNVEVEEHSLGDLNEPNNYKAAILYPKSDKWVDAMNTEMQFVKDNQVWCLVDLPPNYKTVGSKWMALILIATVAFYDNEIWKMDDKTAFLNGYLNEDIYMVQPEGFVNPNHPRKVCKLQRSINGLKQASRS